MKKTTILFVLSLITLNTFSNKKNVPGTYSTIQSALNACGTGDTVLVQPGTYPEHIVWPNINGIKLFSAGDSSNTIIDATLNGRCITINPLSAGIIDSIVVIKGFKLTKGYSDTTALSGVAIYTSNYAQIKLIDVAICKNEVDAKYFALYSLFRGGVCDFRGYSVLLNSSVYSNTVSCGDSFVTGALIAAANINYVNDVISNNQINIVTTTSLTSQGLLFASGPSTALNYLQKTKVLNNNINFSCLTSSVDINGGLLYFDYSNINWNTLTDVLIANNSFTVSSNTVVQGLLCYARLYGTGGVDLLHCTFAENTVAGNPTILTKSFFLFGYYPFSSFTCWNCSRIGRVVNSILWNPSILSGQEIAFSNSSNTSGGGYTNLIALNSNINAFTTGTNCINQNPQFISASDFHLQNTSPCINTGDSAIKIPLDLGGNPRPINIFPDMGCYEYNSSLAVKENSFMSSHYLIYPNPTSNSLNIRTNNNDFENKEIEIINYLGQTVLKTPYADNISVADLSSGYYTIKIITTSGQFNSNFIKE